MVLKTSNTYKSGTENLEYLRPMVKFCDKIAVAYKINNSHNIIQKLQQLAQNIFVNCKWKRHNL